LLLFYHELPHKVIGQTAVYSGINRAAAEEERGVRRTKTENGDENFRSRIRIKKRTINSYLIN
jgi:hypothetical protein